MQEKLEHINFQAFEITGKWELIRERQIKRLRFARKQKIPHLRHLLPCDGRAAIVGASPLVVNYLDIIRKIKAEELGLVWSINGAHDFLIKNGIIPNMHVLFETDLTDARQSLGGEPHQDVYYYVCSHSDPDVFRSLDGYHKVLWHCWNDPPEYQGIISRWFNGEFMIGGGYVTLFRSINIAIVLGYRCFDLYGCDSSFEGENTHINGYHNKTSEDKLTVWVGRSIEDKDKKRFETLPTLAYNAHEFMRFCEIHQPSLSIRVNGNGLLPTLHKSKYPEQYERT